MRDRRTIHVEDILAAEAEFPETRLAARRLGARARTMLADAAAAREACRSGVINISRGPEARPLSAKQIALARRRSPTRRSSRSRTCGCSRSCRRRTARSRRPTRADRDPRAADGDQRDPAGDLELADRHATGDGSHRRERGYGCASATFGAIFGIDGELSHLVAHHDSPPESLRDPASEVPACGSIAESMSGAGHPRARGSPRPRRPRRIREFRRRTSQRRSDRRPAMLAVPLLREGSAHRRRSSSGAPRSAPSPRSRSSC